MISSVFSEVIKEKMYVIYFLADGKEFFDVIKDTSDNKKATIVLKDSFDFDELPTQAGQLSFFVEVLLLRIKIFTFLCCP